MPRRALPSPHLLARIRTWFGLRQSDLALYLGITQQLAQGIEAGRRRLTTAVGEALLPLARQLPPSADLLEAPLPTTLPAGTPPPDAAELDFRRRVCQQRAGRLRAEADGLRRQAHYAHRWAQAQPALQPPPDAADPERAAWLTGWLERRARPLSVPDATRYHLLLAQARALEAEAAALAELRPAAQPAI
ncbi:helix-turn-helix domain-containing protein [Hymenobacter sp. B81]|uniref:helix-turn-helix domain-containing protein n=1 Tax=Hymenobacter sp. B81 TaxID=3344878 RepID=UPI0037DC3E58